MFVLLSYLVPHSYGQTDNETLSSVTEWKTYQNELVGFSFDYPSSWDLNEKPNRFDSAADAEVSGNDMRFIVRKAIDRTEDNPLKTSALLTSTRSLQEGMSIDQGYTIIEPADVKKYTVGGERAGTFLVKHDDGISPAKASQIIMVFHNGDGYMLNFWTPTETFDNPETQNTITKILQSFKFSSSG